MRIWHYFQHGGTPEYLAKHYWWAYIWKFGVWFFDHQPIIASILFGQYQRLLDSTLAIINHLDRGKILQVACVYGKLTPSLADNLQNNELHIIDVANVQLAATREKLNNGSAQTKRWHLSKMNAEQLAYASHTFNTALIFFLLHEMPADARIRTLTESLRVLNNNGRLIIVEYAELGGTHLFHRLWLTRFILGKLEPFLPEFWQQSLVDTVSLCATSVGKTVAVHHEVLEFNCFYRIIEFHVSRSTDVTN